MPQEFQKGSEVKDCGTPRTQDTFSEALSSLESRLQMEEQHKQRLGDEEMEGQEEVTVGRKAGEERPRESSGRESDDVCF